MDIFKILSRSTKQTRKPPGNDAQASRLPSAGSASNPQLFNDPIQGPRGTKRKLGDTKTENNVTEITKDELNFFAPKAEKQKSKQERDSREEEFNNTSNAQPKLLEQDECRQILLSHRLKITLLPIGDVSGAKDEKSRKKSNTRKADALTEKKKKGDYKQIHTQPLVAFEDLRTIYGLSRRLAENIVSQGYRVPTEIQLATLPMQLRPDLALHDAAESLGQVDTSASLDLLAIAPTGSGKTLAFLIPTIEGMVQRRREQENPGHNLEAIVLAPTKELASQIVNEGRKLALGTGIKIVGMRKGMRIVEEGEHEELEKMSDDSEDNSEEESSDPDTPKKTRKPSSQPITKADILVTTPLVLLNALSVEAQSEKLPLPTVRHLILDEADVLLDPLFREQTLGIWESCVNPELHATLWSATMGSNIEALASETIATSRKRRSVKQSTPIIRVVVGLKDSAIPNITHRLIYAANEAGKLLGLRQLLHPTAQSLDSSLSLRPPFLVFTQTIPRAIALHSELMYDIPVEAGGSSRIAVLHSDLSEKIRDGVMTRFRNGEIWVLITTDILSRGVDFRGINGVVNYDIPNSGAAYIHRVGRTGRAGRDGGIAVTFYTTEDIPYVKNVANIIAASEKQAGKPDSERTMQKWLLDSLPTPSKADKKKLKLHGVEARKAMIGKDGKGSKARISTKSGYERRLENKRKGAIRSSKQRLHNGSEASDSEGGGSEWGGFDE